MTNTDILFASLVGSGMVKTIPRLGVIQNELSKHVLPTLPFLPITNGDQIQKTQYPAFDNLYKADPPTPLEQQFFPLSFSIDEGNSYYLLPYETMINISGKNNIVRRNVAKWKDTDGIKRIGSIKERWSQDDYQIDITGVLIGSLTQGSVQDCYPREDFEKLFQVLTTSKKIMVLCPPLELMGISQIVIEDFAFPFTKGKNVQAYTIKAYSDYSYNLILT